MGLDDRHTVIFFDGVCNLCNGFVQFLIKRDPQATLKFASLQSSYAREQLSRAGFNPDQLYSILVMREGKIFERSAAVMEIARHLSWPWRGIRIFRILPTFICDFFYKLIANNRYRLFGKKDACMIPTPELKARFME
jgi:predicted DCC family thiol-disulfide oxidoreductase YuxK